MKVSLSGVVVDKVVTNPPYIVVREPWSSEIRLIVLLDAPMALQRWQTVSVTGFMSTLVTRERALSAAAVSVYTDASGTTALAPLPILPGDPVFPLVNAPLDLSVRSQQSGMETRGLLDPPSSDPPPDGPEYVCATVAEALARDVGDTVQLTAKPVISTGDDAAYGGYAVIGEDEGSEVIRAFTAADLTGASRAAVITGTIALDGNAAKVISVDGGPGYNPQSFVGTAALCVAGSICNAKLSPDAASVGLSSKTVSLLLPEEEALYVHEPGMALGLRVEMSNMPGGLAAGDFVNTLGVMATTPAGERYLAASEMDKQAPGVAPRPLVMTNRTVGGGNWHLTDTAGQAGAAGGQGLNTVGLLTRTTGRVTGVLNDESVIEIDDGSCGAAVCPLWVKLPGVLDIQPGDFVIVTGASSLTGSSSAPERLVRVATADDIQSGCWYDTDAPTVTITTPAADGPTIEGFTAVSGTASDTSRVTKVQVQVNGGSWTDATYTPSTQSWTTPWAPARGDYTISVRAYDCNGHVATATREVSLVDVASAAGDTFTPSYMYGTVITWPSTLNPKENGEAGGNGLIRKSGAGFVWDTYGCERLKALQPGSLRFGNSVSNHYRWRFGIGPVAARPPQQIPGGPNFSLNPYGIGEHLDLCAYVGAKPVIVLPYYTAAEGTAPATNEAANMVLFCTEPYMPALEQAEWELTRINRHLRQDDRLEGEPCNPDPEGCNEWPRYSETTQDSIGYSVNAVVLIDTTPSTGNVPVTDITRPGVKLAFRCTAATAGQTAAVSAPFYGSSWRSYWKYWEPVEIAAEDKSWTTAELAPEGYWAKMRRLTTGSTDGWSGVRWELGNELFADSAVEAADYNAAVQAVKDIVGEYDAPAPAIAVAIPTTREQPAGYGGYTPPEILNPTGGRAYNAIVPHLYCGPSVEDGEHPVLPLFDASAGPDLGARSIMGVNIAEYESACVGALPPIWATELNTRYGAFDPELDEEEEINAAFPHNFELKSGLAAAVMQLDLAAYGAAGSNLFPAVSIQQGSETPGRVFRMIAVDKLELVNDLYPSERRWVTPTYYAHQMLNYLGRGRVESTECSAAGLVAQGFWDYDTFRLFIINTTETAVPFRASLGAGVEVQSGFQHPYVLRLIGENGMQSTNECNGGTQVPAPVFSVDLQGTIEDDIFSGTAPAASMSVYEFVLDPSILDLTGVVSTPSAPLAGATVSCQGSVSITDALGRFYFTDLSPGSSTVTATASGYIITGQQVTIPATGNGGAWAALDAVPRLSGTVKKWADEQHTELVPVAGAAVWVEPSGGGTAVATTVSDCAGNFALPVAAASYTVYTDHPTYNTTRSLSVDVTSSAACVSFTLGDAGGAALCTQ